MAEAEAPDTLAGDHVIPLGPALDYAVVARLAEAPVVVGPDDLVAVLVDILEDGLAILKSAARANERTLARLRRGVAVGMPPGGLG